MTTYKKISIKQLDTLFENLKPLSLERRLTFLKYSKHLIREDLISEVNEVKYSTTDYIRDFDDFERKYIKSKLKEEIKEEIEDELTGEFYKQEVISFFIDFISDCVFLYGSYKLIRICL